MNFLFRGTDRQIYGGTAGHCVLDNGERTFSGFTADTVATVTGRYVGDFVYAINQYPMDFALFRLRPGARYSPQMCHFGGPDGMYEKHQATAMLLQYFGNSPQREDMPARSAVAETTLDPVAVWALGDAAPGDSGSGVINESGEAVGVLVATGYDLSQPGVGVLVTRLDSQLRRAERKLNTRFAMLSAPVNSDLL